MWMMMAMTTTMAITIMTTTIFFIMQLCPA
jgi:hypothetical protein